MEVGLESHRIELDDDRDGGAASEDSESGGGTRKWVVAAARGHGQVRHGSRIRPASGLSVSDGLSPDRRGDGDLALAEVGVSRIDLADGLVPSQPGEIQGAGVHAGQDLAIVGPRKPKDGGRGEDERAKGAQRETDHDSKRPAALARARPAAGARRNGSPGFEDAVRLSRRAAGRAAAVRPGRRRAPDRLSGRGRAHRGALLERRPGRFTPPARSVPAVGLRRHRLVLVSRLQLIPGHYSSFCRVDRFAVLATLGGKGMARPDGHTRPGDRRAVWCPRDAVSPNNS